MTPRLALAALTALVVVVAPTGANAGPAKPGLSALKPWTRAVPPGNATTAAYFTLKNDGPTDVRVVAAQSPAAGTTELHTHVNEGGVMKMRAVPAIEVKAHSETQLEPGGLHVMLINLVKPLNEGDIVTITLTLADKSTLVVQAPVTQPPVDAGAGHHGAGHGAHHGGHQGMKTADATPVDAFHDVLAPLWHAPASAACDRDTCAAAPELQKRAQALTGAKPAGATADYDPAVQGLNRAVAALQKTCAAKSPVPPALTAVHDAFHQVAACTER